MEALLTQILENQRDIAKALRLLAYLDNNPKAPKTIFAILSQTIARVDDAIGQEPKRSPYNPNGKPKSPEPLRDFD